MCNAIDTLVEIDAVTQEQVRELSLHDPRLLVLWMLSEIKELKPYADEYKVLRP